jgi:TatD DNase family protein
MTIQNQTTNPKITKNLYDSHGHLDLLLSESKYILNSRDVSNFEHLKEIIEIDEFIENSLTDHEFFIHPTVSTDNLIQVSSLFSKFENIYFLIGSHPEIVTSKFDLNSYLIKQRGVLSSKIIDENKLKAIGEIGLDYYYTQDNFILNLQKSLFESQIDLAIKLNLPIQIHCRNSFEDLFAILNNFPSIKNRFLIHCFTGDIKDAENVFQRGGKIGIGGIVTFKNSLSLQKVVEISPIDNIILETDLPFLAPVPFRGKTCLPKFIQETANFVAKLQNSKVEDVLCRTKQNAKSFFAIK